MATYLGAQAYNTYAEYERQMRLEQEKYMQWQQYAMRNVGIQQMPPTLANSLGLPQSEPEPNPVLLLL